MQCDICRAEVSGEEGRKHMKFVTVEKRQVTICTTCTTTINKLKSGCVVAERGSIAMPTLVFDGFHGTAIEIARECGWKLSEDLEENEDHVVIDEHWEHAINGYVYVRDGQWSHTGNTKENCFRQSCTNIKDRFGEYWIHHMGE